jgi:transposase
MKRKIPVRGVLRCFKIRMYPTPEQREVLDTWMRAANWSYNQAVERLRLDGMKRGNTIKLKKEIVGKDVVPQESQWVLRVASRIRARAVQQAVDAQNTNIAKLRANPHHHFFLSFRSRAKDPKRCAIMEKGKDGPVKGFVSMDRASNSRQKEWFGMRVSWGSDGLGEGVNPIVAMRDKRRIANRLIGDGPLAEDAKLLYDRRVGGYWLSVTFDMPVKTGSLDPSTSRVGALDPGCRAFNTYYSPDGTHGELLAGELGYMERCVKKVDTIYSRLETEKKERQRQVMSRDEERLFSAEYCRRRLQMRKKALKIMHKMRCRMTNAHYDAANALLQEFDVILVPLFETSKMVRRAERVINSKVARAMYTWGHFTFRQRLLSKIEMDSSKHMRVVGEPGTSKTCGNCGHWNADLGGKKILVCGSCNVEMDRDVNGARNNLLAELTSVLTLNN